MISGTTATHGPNAIGGDDPAAQAHFIIDKNRGRGAIIGWKAGRHCTHAIFIRNISDWEVIAPGAWREV